MDNQRLAIVVRSFVASALADDAKQRSAFLEKQLEPFTKARARFGQLYRRKPDWHNPGDLVTVMNMASALGGGHIGPEHWDARIEQLTEQVRCVEEANEALRALQLALRATGTPEDTPLTEWIGCTGEELDAAIRAALTG
jgi:hypothetical protein